MPAQFVSKRDRSTVLDETIFDEIFSLAGH
jgi:hypothetical protein